MKQLFKKLTAAASVLVLLMTFVPMQSAHAAFPGLNGKIVFHSNRSSGNYEIYTMNLDGSGVTNLTNNPSGESNANWSPDGTQIVFTSFRDGNGEIYIMDADGSNQTRITNNPASDSSAAFSPDGTEIVFVSNRDGNDEIYTMNSNGSNQTRITNNGGADVNPAWSPDGTKILFQRAGGLRTISPTGTDETAIAGGNNPSWSPDSTKITYNTAASGDQEIFTAKADGSNIVRVTFYTGVDSVPDFSPDDTKIVFRSVRDGNNEIYLMNADGSDQVRLTNNTFDDNNPHIQPLTIPPASLQENPTLMSHNGEAVSFNVFSNTTDVYADINLASITVLTLPRHGSAAVDPTTGVITYTPNQNFAGSDSYSYQICSIASAQLCTINEVYIISTVDERSLAQTGSNTNSVVLLGYVTGGVGIIGMGWFVTQRLRAFCSIRYN